MIVPLPVPSPGSEHQDGRQVRLLLAEGDVERDLRRAGDAHVGGQRVGHVEQARVLGRRVHQRRRRDRRVVDQLLGRRPRPGRSRARRARRRRAPRRRVESPTAGSGHSAYGVGFAVLQARLTTAPLATDWPAVVATAVASVSTLPAMLVITRVVDGDRPVGVGLRDRQRVADAERRGARDRQRRRVRHRADDRRLTRRARGRLAHDPRLRQVLDAVVLVVEVLREPQVQQEVRRRAAVAALVEVERARDALLLELLVVLRRRSWS